MSEKKTFKNLLSNSKESLTSSKKFLYKYEDLSLYKKALEGYIKKSKEEEELAKLTNAGAFQRERYSNKSLSGALIEEYLYFPKNDESLQKLENNHIAKPMDSSDYQAFTAIKTLIEYFEEKLREIQFLESKQDTDNEAEIGKKRDRLNMQINLVKELAKKSNTYKTSTINEIATDFVDNNQELSEILNIIEPLKASDLNGENKGSTNESKEFLSSFLLEINSNNEEKKKKEEDEKKKKDEEKYNIDSNLIKELGKIKSSYINKTININTLEDYSKTIRAIRTGDFEQEIEEEYRILESRGIKEENLLKITPETFRDFSLDAMKKVIIKKAFLETLHEEEWYKNLLEEVKEVVEENDIDESGINNFVETIDSEILRQVEERIILNIQATGEISSFPFNIPIVKWTAEKIGKKFDINKNLLDIQANFNIDFKSIFKECIKSEGGKDVNITPELQNSFELSEKKFKKKFSLPTVNLISSNIANTIYISRKIPVKTVNVLRHRDEGISHNILTQNQQNVSGIASLKNEIDSRRKQIRLTNARLVTFKKDKKKNYFEIKKKIDELEREKFVLKEAEGRLYNLEKKILLEIKTRNFSNLKKANDFSEDMEINEEDSLSNSRKNSLSNSRNSSSSNGATFSIRTTD